MMDFYAYLGSGPIRVNGYMHHSNGGNDGGQYKIEVVAIRIKYLVRKK